MGSISKHESPRFALISRIMAAIIGGYILTNLLAILLSYLLPMPQSERVLTAMLVSFVIYTAVILWVFTTKTATKAWIGIAIPSLISAACALMLMPEKLL
ncbi:hypothetical protein ACWXWU_15905 [Shewanella sp. A14]